MMLKYKSFFNMTSYYLCELISRRKSYVNTRLGGNHPQIIMPPISKDCSNTFLERSFTYAAPCEWNKLSDYVRRVLKYCYLHNTMDADWKQFI